MTDDPQRDRLYRAESEALATTGPRFHRWTDVVGWVEAVVTDSEWFDRFPDAPVEVAVLPRSRSARWSVAEIDRAVIHIRQGSWDAPTVLHELAHLAAPLPPAHGADFAAAELHLVRSFLGFHAYGALMHSFRVHGVHHGSVRAPLAGPVEP